jgi:hypothetical protein
MCALTEIEYRRYAERMRGRFTVDVTIAIRHVDVRVRHGTHAAEVELSIDGTHRERAEAGVSCCRTATCCSSAFVC